MRIADRSPASEAVSQRARAPEMGARALFFVELSASRRPVRFEHPKPRETVLLLKTLSCQIGYRVFFQKFIHGLV